MGSATLTSSAFGGETWGRCGQGRHQNQRPPFHRPQAGGTGGLANLTLTPNPGLQEGRGIVTA